VNVQCILGGARPEVGLNSLKSLNLTKVYPNNNKVKSKPLELYEIAGNFFFNGASKMGSKGGCKYQYILGKTISILIL
jgi:hypothetical protein